MNTEPGHPHRIVTKLEERLSSLEADFHRAWWDSQIDATPENERRRAEIELELRRVKGDPDALAAVQHALEGEVHDPVLRRQLEVLRLSLTGNQMADEQRFALVEVSSAVESDFASYRPEVDGSSLSDNEIDDILKTSDDLALRRRVWEASKEVGAAAADRVRELARLRNEVARDLGYADHYQFSLDLQEIPEKWLFEICDELEELTDAPFTRWKGELDGRLMSRFGADEPYPWLYADPFFQTAPPDGRVSLDEHLKDVSAAELAEKTFGAWGMDISSVIQTSDLFPRDKKSQHAFCIDMDRSGEDVRILANVVPGEHWVEVMLHESGHAAYDIAIDPHLPWLLHRPSHLLTTEAMALLSGRLIRDPEWLTSIGGVAAPEVAELAPRLRDTSVTESLVFARWCLVMVHFERDLYADPEADLDSRWWELVQRFQKVTPPPERNAPDWAAKVHLAVAPVYYQNYLLGDLFAAQLRASIEAECGGFVGNEAAGRLLIDRLFHPGALLRWDSLVEQATGRPLTARDFAAALNSA